MSLVKVWTDVGSRKPVPLLARVVEKQGEIFTIRYLSESDDKIWRYEDDTYEIDNESIAEYLKTDLEEDAGFKICEDGFVKIDSDDDYIPSDSDEESYDDEDEEEEEEDLIETETEDEEEEDEEEEENLDD